MYGGLAAATVRQELQVFPRLFETTRKEWGMEGLLNPLKNIREPSASNERNKLKPGEFDRTSSEIARRVNPYALPAFELVIEISLRQAMLFAMRWEWVDLNTREVCIPIEYRRNANKGVMAELPLSSRAIAVLRGIPCVEIAIILHRKSRKQVNFSNVSSSVFL